MKGKDYNVKRYTILINRINSWCHYWISNSQNINDKSNDEWNGEDTITKTSKSNDETNEQIYVIK